MNLYRISQITNMINKSDIDYFFSPKSIAVIGASRNPKKFGHIIFRNLLGSGKKVYPINPNASEVLGKKSYANVKDVKEPVDLAVIVVPAASVVQSVVDCKEKGVKAAVIISAGFAEAGNAEGEEKIKQLKGNMRIIGPNVIGLYDAYSGIDTVFNLRHRQQRPLAGGISFISQSGAFGSALLDMAAFEHIGFSKFVSLGNMLDISETDMLNYLMYDEKTHAVAMYLEGSKNYVALYKALKSVTKIKPVVVVKAGKTEETKKAVASHTASLAGESKIFSGMLKQAGALEANAEDMFGIAKVFSQPNLHNNRVHIVTDGGGFGILAADALVASSMRLSRLSPATTESIRKLVPPYASVANPLDLTGDADTNRYSNIMPLVLNDKNVDAVIVILLMQISALDSKIVDVIAAMKRFKKPVAVCMPGGEFTNLHRRMLEEKGIPTYTTPEKAAAAVKALYDCEKMRRRK